MSAFTLGLDFGTNSVRAVVVSCADGSTVGSCVFDYLSGDSGVLLDSRDPHLARQNPADYLVGLRESVRDALEDADGDVGFPREAIIGIGVDTTGSTPLPVDEKAQPLALNPAWEKNLSAHAWLW
ncbi:MAG: ribulokinase, partial [Gemmatimonadota bacterium]